MRVNDKALLSQLQREATAKVNELSSQHIVKILLAMATMGSEDDALIAQLQNEVTAKVGTMVPEDVIMMLWSAAMLKFKSRGPRDLKNASQEHFHLMMVHLLVFAIGHACETELIMIRK